LCNAHLLRELRGLHELFDLARLMWRRSSV
jgi:hypothetical protein